MPFITDYQQKFADLAFHLNHQDQLRRQANGGNSVLFSYPPEEEGQYIEKAKEFYTDKAEFIDVSQLLVEFIDEEGWESFEAYFKEFEATPHLVFRSDDPSPDLFDMIIGKIEEACQNDRIPFLVRTGCLYGTGIDNVNIMENQVVMALPHPLIIFYPATCRDDNLYFLNFKPASKYRCTLVK